MEAHFLVDVTCLRNRRSRRPCHQNYGRSRTAFGYGDSNLERTKFKLEISRISIRSHRGFDRILCGFAFGELANRDGLFADPDIDRLLPNVRRRALFI